MPVVDRHFKYNEHAKQSLKYCYYIVHDGLKLSIAISNEWGNAVVE
jgi:hypothetical protein